MDQLVKERRSEPPLTRALAWKKVSLEIIKLSMLSQRSDAMNNKLIKNRNQNGSIFELTVINNSIKNVLYQFQ